MRKLNPEEAELWGRVTASIRPLHRDRPAPLLERNAAPDTQPRPPKPLIPDKVRSPPPRPTTPPLSRVQPIQAQTLDGHWDRRLRSGTVVPDQVLDLHGHNLDGAWSAIDRTLEHAIARGDRVVLLVTGHARKGEPPIARGRIRAAVHDWLAASRHAPSIAAVRDAHRRHGGGGSLYLILRRGS
nr:Smr/MutS family protein [Sphingomonas ginkgonis]